VRPVRASTSRSRGGFAECAIAPKSVPAHKPVALTFTEASTAGVDIFLAGIAALRRR